MKCPDNDCAWVLTDEDVKINVSDHDYERYLKFKK